MPLASALNTRFGPTSTKTRAPSRYSVSTPLMNCTGEATCCASSSTISSRVWGYSSPVTLATMGSRGGRMSISAMISRSGMLAGATIRVWKAWETGICTAR